MKPGRTLTIIALVQLVAIFYGILATGVFCKIGGLAMANGGATVPVGYRWAAGYRDYGIWLALVVFAWVIYAVSRLSSTSNRELAIFQINRSGIYLTVFYVLVSSFFVLCAMTALSR